MKEPIYKILDQIARTKSKPRRVGILQRNKTKQLVELLSYATNPNIQFELPEGTPPYEPGDGINSEEEIYARVRILENFVSVNGVPVKNIPKMRRQNLFVELLESVHPEDAKILVGIKDKNLKLVNADLLREAFPEEVQF